METISQDLKEDWTSTVFLLKNQNRIKDCQKITEKERSEKFYILPIVHVQKDFNDILRLAYQKCLYGPLTTIPRPLKLF